MSVVLDRTQERSEPVDGISKLSDENPKGDDLEIALHVISRRESNPQ